MNETRAPCSNTSMSWAFPVTFTRSLFSAAIRSSPRPSITSPETSQASRDDLINGRVASLPTLRHQATAYFAAHPQQLELVGPPQIVPEVRR